jgi:hypothetical protein
MQNSEILALAEKIHPERLMKRLDQLAQIGKSAQNGVTRLAFTEEDRLARRFWSVQSAIFLEDWAKRMQMCL